MQVIRWIFGGVAMLWLLGVLVIGVGTTWLTHNPEDAAAIAVGAASVDGDASFGTQAGQFGAGVRDGHAMIEAAQASEMKREMARQLYEEREELAEDGWGLDAQ